MSSFEAVFKVPLQHRLELVRSRSRGGELRGEYCSHEEFDSYGRLVARYESFCEIDQRTGSAKSGWSRQAPEGCCTEPSEEVRALLELL